MAENDTTMPAAITSAVAVIAVVAAVADADGTLQACLQLYKDS